jgi:hypothetical protein
MVSAAPVGEPLQRAADADAVHDAGAQPADAVADVDPRHRVRPRVDGPRQRGEDAAEDDQRTWTEQVGEVGLERHQPGFGQEEEREGERDRSHGGPEAILNGFGKEGPVVLQVRDRDHADDAGRELHPAVAAHVASPSGKPRS